MYFYCRIETMSDNNFTMILLQRKLKIVLIQLSSADFALN